MLSPYHEDSFEQQQHELFLNSLEDAIDQEHAAHARALRQAAASTWVTELEVTTRNGETWVIEVGNNREWSPQIDEFLLLQGIDNWDWVDDYEPLNSWDAAEENQS